MNYKTYSTINTYTTAYICLIAVCILWGTTWVASAWSVRKGVSALQVVAIRQLIGGLLLCTGIIAYHKGKVKWPSVKDTILLSILNFVFSNGLSTWGVQYLPAGFASIIAATYPLWLVLIYTFWFKKSINSNVWIGMLIAFSGLIIIFYPKMMQANYEDNFFFGLALAIFSTFTWSLGTIYTKNQTSKDIDPYFSLGAQMLLSGICLIVLLQINGTLQSLSTIQTEVWYGIWYLVIAGSIVAYSCFLFALKTLPAEQVSIYAYINPIVALIISHAFMNEEITSYLILGGVIVLFGVYKVNRAFKI